MVGFSRAKYGHGAMALVGSGREMVPCGARVSGEVREGSRRDSGRTNVLMWLVEDEVKRVVPSADLEREVLIFCDERGIRMLGAKK